VWGGLHDSGGCRLRGCGNSRLQGCGICLLLDLLLDLSLGCGNWPLASHRWQHSQEPEQICSVFSYARLGTLSANNLPSLSDHQPAALTTASIQMRGELWAASVAAMKKNVIRGHDLYIYTVKTVWCEASCQTERCKAAVPTSAEPLTSMATHCEQRDRAQWCEAGQEFHCQLQEASLCPEPARPAMGKVLALVVVCESYFEDR